MEPLPFDHWVNDNNPPASLEYGKGWWDYIEMVRRFMDKFSFTGAEVIGTYLMRTPPPPEELLMPVVRLSKVDVELILKYDFGRYPEAWTISARAPGRHAGSTLGLFDPGADLRKKEMSGFNAEWVYPPYGESPRCFTCELLDEWDVAAFVRLISATDR